MPSLTDTPPPRGALAIVIVGLLATVAAHLLTTDKPIGAVELEWVERKPLPDSPSAEIPGGGTMRIVDSGIRAAEPNAAGYRLFRIAAVLEIEAGSAVGQGRVNCAIDVPQRTIPAKTPNSRASYPKSSSGEDLRKQDVPDEVLVQFSARGSDTVALELGDAFPVYVNAPGVVVSWAPYRQAIQEWQWGLPEGRPQKPLRLGFATIWRTTTSASGEARCTVATADGEVTVATRGSL